MSSMVTVETYAPARTFDGTLITSGPGGGTGAPIPVVIDPRPVAAVMS